MGYFRQVTLLSIIVFFVLNAFIAKADEIKIPIYSAADNKSMGYIKAMDTPQGLLLIPNLNHLPPGVHGMHIHQFASCANHAIGAGEHWDPNLTGKHRGPYKNGHLGDLPALKVNNDGKATMSVVAPRLTVKDLEGHSIVIHVGGDNYTDNPPLGGAGARFACGVVS